VSAASRRDAENEDQGRRSTAEFVATDPPLSLAVMRVLVVDDHEGSREAIRQLLQYFGATVTIAASGHEALPLAVLEPPQPVLCDLRMSGMDGFAVLAGLRALLPDHVIRVVAVSGYGRDEDRRRTREAGFDGHLVKPVDLDTLVTTVRQLLRRPAG
jgi:CheY-like chemotaxis protein